MKDRDTKQATGTKAKKAHVCDALCRYHGVFRREWETRWGDQFRGNTYFWSAK